MGTSRETLEYLVDADVGIRELNRLRDEFRGILKEIDKVNAKGLDISNVDKLRAQLDKATATAGELRTAFAKVTAEIGKQELEVRQLEQAHVEGEGAAKEEAKASLEAARQKLQNLRSIKRALEEEQDELRQQEAVVKKLAATQKKAQQQLKADLDEASQAARRLQQRLGAVDDEPAIDNSIADLKRMRDQLKKAGANVTDLNRRIRKIDQANTGFGRFTKSVGKLTSGFRLLKVAAIGFFAIRIAQLVGRQVEAFLDYKAALDAAHRSLVLVTDDHKEAEKELAFVRDTAFDLGVAFLELTDGHAKLSVAARGTALAQAQVREITESLATASKVLNLEAEQTGGIFTALEQILSKGRLQSEELRRQLGNRLPGVFRIAAEAMGLTTAELEEQIRLGKIAAEDFLPRFAQAVKAAYGPQSQAAASDLAAEINRLKLILIEANQEGVEAAEAGIRDLTGSLVEAQDEIGTLSRVAGELAGGAASALGTTVEFTAKAIDLAATATEFWNQKLRDFDPRVAEADRRTKEWLATLKEVTEELEALGESEGHQGLKDLADGAGLTAQELVALARTAGITVEEMSEVARFTGLAGEELRVFVQQAKEGGKDIRAHALDMARLSELTKDQGDAWARITELQLKNLGVTAEQRDELIKMGGDLKEAAEAQKGYTKTLEELVEAADAEAAALRRVADEAEIAAQRRIEVDENLLETTVEVEQVTTERVKAELEKRLANEHLTAEQRKEISEDVAEALAEIEERLSERRTAAVLKYNEAVAKDGADEVELRKALTEEIADLYRDANEARAELLESETEKVAEEVEKQLEIRREALKKEVEASVDALNEIAEARRKAFEPIETREPGGGAEGIADLKKEIEDLEGQLQKTPEELAKLFDLKDQLAEAEAAMGSYGEALGGIDTSQDALVQSSARYQDELAGLVDTARKGAKENDALQRSLDRVDQEIQSIGANSAITDQEFRRLSEQIQNELFESTKAAGDEFNALGKELEAGGDAAKKTGKDFQDAAGGAVEWVEVTDEAGNKTKVLRDKTEEAGKSVKKLGEETEKTTEVQKEALTAGESLRKELDAISDSTVRAAVASREWEASLERILALCHKVKACLRSS